MRGIRYSLLTLLGLTTVIAIAIAALRSGDWFWSRSLYTLTLALNLSAILGAIYFTGRRRAFWMGFALFGWTCWAIANLPSFRIAEHQLFARQLDVMLKDHVPDGNDGIVVDANGSRIAIFSFRQIVTSVFGLLFSAVGGVIGLWFYYSRGGDSGAIVIANSSAREPGVTTDATEQVRL